MKPWPVVAAVLLMPLMPGCAGPAAPSPCNAGAASFAHAEPDQSMESLMVRVNATAAFDISIPMPVSVGGTTAAAWAANATSTNGRVEFRDSERGPVLHLAGPGLAVATSCSIQPARRGGVAEAYLDAQWTTAPGRNRPDTVFVQGAAGSLQLTIEYHARSAYCSRDARFEGRLAASGWQDLQGLDQAVCE